jgi:hypothetical protein
MPELFFLGAQILFGVRAGCDFAGNALHHVNSGAFERFDLIRVIGKQPYASDTQCLQNSTGKGKVPMVGFEAKSLVGLDRVESFVL